MTLLLIGDLRPDPTLPAFSGELEGHIAAKTHPSVRRASLSAWALLARGLRMLGVESLPSVAFGARGKPYFADSELHFSLAHSGEIAAALISDAPCGVDVEEVRGEVSARLYARCLNEAERGQNLPFFECWTKKECIGKRSGLGIGAHPADVDTLDPRWHGQFYTQNLRVNGREYVLSALCENAAALRVERILPETSL